MGSEQQRRLRCLWIDLKVSIAVAETPQMFSATCVVRRVAAFDERAMAQQPFDFVVVEFDYPGRSDLARATSFKQNFPHVPIVAITVQHSEALSVWFFREHFFDYLVQPLSQSDVSRCLERLQAVLPFAAAQPPRRFAPLRVPPPREAGGHESLQAKLQPALSLIERSFHQRLPVSEAAAACGMPPLKFGREFKDYFGIEFREFVLRYRIREACRLLRNPKASVTEVGYSVGFSEPSYFTKMFKKMVGQPPSAVAGDPGLDFPLEEWGTENYQNSFQNS